MGKRLSELINEMTAATVATEGLVPGQTPLRITNQTMRGWNTIQGVPIDKNAKIPEDRKNFFFVEPGREEEVIKKQWENYFKNPTKYGLSEESTVEDAIKKFDQQAPQNKINFLKKKGIDVKQKIKSFDLSLLNPFYIKEASAEESGPRRLSEVMRGGAAEESGPRRLSEVMRGGAAEVDELNFWGDIGNRPAAAIRSGIRSIGKDGFAKGYERGANKPLSVPTFQDQAIDAYMKKYGTASTFKNFMGGLLPSTVGVAADFATNPLDLLLTLTGGRIARQISKIPVGVSTLGEVVNTPVSQISRVITKTGTARPFLPMSPIEAIQSRQSAEALITARTATESLRNVITGTSGATKQSQINLDRFPDDTVGALKAIVTNDPELISKKVITNKELVTMANNLDDTVLTKKILSMPEGTFAAEDLKLWQETEGLVRSLLTKNIDDMAMGIKKTLVDEKIYTTARIGSEIGRALQQRKMNIGPQQRIADAINLKISQIKKDPMIGKETAKSLVSGLLDLKKKALSKDFNPSWFDKGYEFWLNNILSSPFTHEVNIVSNVLFALAKPPEKALYSSVDALLSLYTGKRTHYFSEIPAQVRGLFNFIKGRKLSIPVPAGTKLDTVKPAAISGKIGEIIRMPTRALVWEDDFAKRMVGWMELAGKAEVVARKEGLRGAELIARRNQLLLNPTDKIISSVQKEQLYRTFQDMTAIGEVVTRLPQKFLRWILPFRKTLSSIIDKGVERSPVGIAKIATRAGRSVVGAAPYGQETVAVDVGNLIAGCGITVGVLYGMLQGRITGAPPKDKAKRDVFYAQGKQPYSFFINGKWYPFIRIEPYGTSAAQTVDMLQGYMESEKEDVSAKTMDAVMSLSKGLASKTFLSGITNFVNAVANPEIYGERFISQLFGGFVPFSGALRTARNIVDERVRDPQGIVEQLANQIPGLSQYVEPRINSFGEEIIRKPVGLSKYIPFPVTKDEQNYVAEELERLDMALGYPDKKMRSILRTGKPKEIGRGDYNRLLAGTGSTITGILNKVMVSPQYMSAPDEIRVRVIENIVSSVRKIGMEQLRAGMGRF